MPERLDPDQNPERELRLLEACELAAQIAFHSGQLSEIDSGKIAGAIARSTAALKRSKEPRTAAELEAENAQLKAELQHARTALEKIMSISEAARRGDNEVAYRQHRRVRDVAAEALEPQ